MNLNKYISSLFDPENNLEDPIVQYYIVKESLEMKSGKIGAQCAHASAMFCRAWENFGHQIPEMISSKEVIQAWFSSSFTKIVLKASDKEFEKIKELPHFLVTDAGRTEVKPGSETVICLLPMRKSEAPKMVKRLRCL